MARQACGSAPGVKLVDDPAAKRYPMPVDASGQGDVLVGRIRHTTSNALTRAVQTLKSANAVLIGSVATDEPVEFKLHIGGSDGPKSGGGKSKKAAPKAAAKAASQPEAKTAAHQKP